jgi:5-methylcytosine-specific restriction enzyme subunit McrC
MWHKNNQYYSLPITICELVFLMELPDENNDGKVHFKDFIQKHEKEMANLFENFVYKFYEREIDKLNVHKSKINWDLDENYNEEKGQEYIPKMRTDIILEYENKQLIIDTKFYKKILSQFHEKTMLHSPNLYQIHAYVTNSTFPEKKMGMLLYASLGEDIDYQFKIKDNIIFIKTINLNQNWEGIDKRLREIANILFLNV